MELLVAMAIPAIGNGHPKLDFITASARELKRAVSHVVELEWEKLTRFFFPSEKGPKEAPHLTDLNHRLVHVDAHFKCESAAVF